MKRDKTKKLLRYSVPFMVLTLIFGFALACNGCETSTEEVSKVEEEKPVVEEVIKEEMIEKPIEEEVIEPTKEEIKDYIGRIVVIGLKVSGSTSTFGQSCLDAGNGKISTSKNKEDTNNFIKDINDCYDIYLSLEVPENFNVPHELMGIAMDHFINATIYLQQYIDTEDINDMTGYLGQATSEIKMGSEYLIKATEQYNKLAPEPEEEVIEEEPIEEPIEEEGEEDPNTTETSSGETDSATLGEKNAVKKALDYLAYTSFSYSGLIAQLEYEGFTHEEAVYGVDKCGADWKEQAALKAEDYLNYSSFSRTELIAQLEYEGFTRQQAEYGVQAVGY
ncbi:hypothetical protein ES702_02236 [subsurface metagenome]